MAIAVYKCCGDLRSKPLALYPTGGIRTRETGENIDWIDLYDEYFSYWPITVIARRALLARRSNLFLRVRRLFTPAGLA